MERSAPSRARRRAPSYEQVAQEHSYPQQPRDSSRKEMGSREVGLHFVRSAFFLTPDSCFSNVEAYYQCCVLPVRHRSYKTPGWCFDFTYTESLCCGKQRFWRHLLTPFQSPRNISHRPTRSTWPTGCSSLRAWRKARLLEWLHGLLALPRARQASCAAGSLGVRLLRAAPEEALEALAVLSAAADEQCPGRRALVTLRRNVMLWHHYTADSEHLPAGSAEAFSRLLEALERCRRALPDAPVLHLHVPKTAGSSLCSWANQSGLTPAQDRGAPCFFYGDGPVWLGQAGHPASCKQRLRESAAANVSWMSVERWLDLPLCEGLRYSVALREPISRMVHHFKHLLNYFLKGEMGVRWQGSRESLIQGFFSRLWRFDGIQGSLRNFSRNAERDGDWLDLWLGMSGNYQVRSLAGAGAGLAFLEDAPAAGQRLRAALQALEQVDSVLVVGSGRLSKSQQRLLGYNLQVPGGLEVPFVSHHVSSGSEKDILPSYSWDPWELREAEARNAADSLLLERAGLLEALDRRYLVLVGLDA